MKEETELAPDVKHCPICTQELPISEFGICRARKDGRNLYCKSCIRKTESEFTVSWLQFREVVLPTSSQRGHSPESQPKHLKAYLNSRDILLPPESIEILHEQ
jgi:hypothetical protein